MWPSIKPSYGFQKQRKGHFIRNLTPNRRLFLFAPKCHFALRQTQAVLRNVSSFCFMTTIWRFCRRATSSAPQETHLTICFTSRAASRAGSRCIFWSAGLVFRRLLPSQLFLDDWYSPHDGCESRSEISPRGWPAAKYCSHRPAATEFWTSKVSRTLPVFWFCFQKKCTCSVMTLILYSCCLWGSLSFRPFKRPNCFSF